MLANDYPIPTYMVDPSLALDAGANDNSLGEDWVETPQPVGGSGPAEIYAVDCEMVGRATIRIIKANACIVLDRGREGAYEGLYD